MGQRRACQRIGVSADIGLRQQVADGVVGEGLHRRDVGGDCCRGQAVRHRQVLLPSYSGPIKAASDLAHCHRNSEPRVLVRFLACRLAIARRQAREPQFADRAMPANSVVSSRMYSTTCGPDPIADDASRLPTTPLPALFLVRCLMCMGSPSSFENGICGILCTVTVILSP